MPGLATHILVNTLTGKVLKAGKYLPIFILGSILPDVLTRIPSNTLQIINKLCRKLYDFEIHTLSAHISWFMAPFHTPFILLLFCYILALSLPQPIRKPFFGWLWGGVFLHLGLDALQRHIGFAYYWLFPFSWQSYSQGLFWPETPLYSLLLLIVIWLVMVLQSRTHIGRQLRIWKRRR